MIKSSVISQLETVIAHEPVDEVFIALSMEKYSHLVKPIVQLCEEQGIIVRLQSELFKLRVARWQLDELNGLPIFTIRSGPPEGWQLMAKRLIDVWGSIALLLLLTPLLFVVALLIKLDSPGPVFFKQ